MEEAKLRGEKENIPFWKAIQLEDAQERDVKIEDSWEKMKYMWQSMLDALDAYEPDKVSRSGLVGTEGGLMDSYRETKEPLCGDFVAKVMSNALKMGCNNACMKRIVAAPTAGACGVLPAVLVTYYKEYNVPEEKMIEAMYVAAGLGQIIANRAYLAGASGGCQAEIGSGSGMAAGAICYIKGGDTDQIGQAVPAIWAVGDRKPGVGAWKKAVREMDGGAKWKADVAHSHPAGCGRRHRGIFDVAAICKGTGGTGL